MRRADTSREAVAPVELENLDGFLRDGIEALPQVDAEEVEREITPSLTRQPEPRRDEPTRESAPPVQPRAAPVPKPPPPPRESRAPQPDLIEGLSLAMGEGDMQATLTVDCRRVVGLTGEVARKWLGTKGVKHGIDQEAVEELVRQVTPGDGQRISAVVARGTPVVHGRPTVVECAQLTDEEVAGLEERARLLREFAELQIDGEPKEHLVGFPLVGVGEDMGRLRPAQVPTHGRNVLGEEVKAEEPRGQDAVVGQGAKLNAESGAILSQAYGYVCMADNELWVIPAVRLSSDGMQCYLLDLQPPNRSPEAGGIAREAMRVGVVEPLKASRVREALSSEGTGARLVLLAEGRPPQNGSDGQAEHKVDVVAQVGTIQEDGSIDFKQRKASTVVQEGAFLAVVTPPTDGIPGLTLRGEEVPAQNGDLAQLEIGAGVRREEHGQDVHLYASEEGNATTRDGVLQVIPEYEIGQDVDYDTGNIDFNGDVIVKGVVRGGFSVTARRDVFVEAVENGASVTAGGAVIVKRGIIGERTTVHAETLIQAQFAQDAVLKCKYQVEIGTYAYGARIEAGQKVKIHGKGERGGAVGGRILAGGEIDLAIMGSEYGTPTRAVVGVDREQVKRKKRIEQGMRTCERYVSQVHESLGVMEGAGVDEFARVLKKLGPKRRKEAQALLRKLQELGKMKDKLEEEQESLDRESKALAGAACIRVRGTLHTGSAITVGDRTFKPAETIRGVELRLSASGAMEKMAV